MELRTAHPIESREITPLGAWIFSRVLIVTSTFMFVPFIQLLFQAN